MIGEGVHKEYKEKARKGGDILWHVTIKGRKELAEGIPLHMSLKVFGDKSEMDMEEIKRKVVEFKIRTPSPDKLTFKTDIFHVKVSNKDYYMLMVEGCDKEYKEFYDSMKHCGTVYDKFMTHITIDKELYDQINEEGLESGEIKFDDLSVEFGSGNTVLEFSDLEKSEHFIKIMKEVAFYTDLRDSIVIALPDTLFKNWLMDNPEGKAELLQKHEERIRFHFKNESVIKYAVEHGIEKAYEFLRKTNETDS